MGSILQVRDLAISFFTYAGEVHAVRGVSFDVQAGEALAVVGESGSGKSVTGLAITGLVPEPGKVVGGSIILDGQEVTRMSQKELQRIRGSKVGMIFQDPMTSLNPTMTVGKQISEGLIKHQGLSGHQAMQRAVEMLHLVGIPQPEVRVRNYPYQLSGGQRQRVMIALALACRPALLIADEPTTALDVTVQAQILDLMKELQEQFGMAIILITHDLGVVARLADRVAVMYAGQIVETGTTEDVFYNPQHPYTRGLLRSVPNLADERGSRLISISGSPPDLFQVPSGCAFAPRCPHAMQICLQADPPVFRIANAGGKAEEPGGSGVESEWLQGMTVDSPAEVTPEVHRSSCWLLHERAEEARRRALQSNAAARDGRVGGRRLGA